MAASSPFVLRFWNKSARVNREGHLPREGGGGGVLLHLRNLSNLELAKRNSALNLMAHSPLQSSRTTKASVAFSDLYYCKL